MSKCPYCKEIFAPDQMLIEEFKVEFKAEYGSRAGPTHFLSFDCPKCQTLLFIKRP
jgi:phage FluMu protein Com